MKNKLLLTFIVVSLLQLAVPVKMIFDKESVITTGTDYKFRTAPIDPYDPFRGKYITLSFDANSFDVSNDKEWHTGDVIYVQLTTDSAGFAKILFVRMDEPPEAKPDYVKAKVLYAYDNKITIEYNFNRFFMEETKAANAEKVYREANRRNMDTVQAVYALVSVMKGDAVIKDVIINGTSVKDLKVENASE